MSNRKIAVSLSPLALLTLAACGGSTTSSDLITQIFSASSGRVEDGPLHNAIAFLDYNGNGLLDSGEPSARTGSDGSYSLTPTQATYSIVAITDDNTIDTVSGATVSGVTLKAPLGSSMVTPTTTLMEDGGLTAAEVMVVLGLPEDMDPLTYSAHADISKLTGTAKTDAEALALKVELANQQILSVVNSFAATAEGSGVSEAAAFSAALMSVAEVIKIEASKSTIVTLDLSNATALGAIETKLVQKVSDLANAEVAAKALDSSVVLKISSDEFAATMIETVKAAGAVNAKIRAITDTDLTSVATKGILSISQVLKDQVKAAAEATVTINAGNADGDVVITVTVAFASTDPKALTDAISNKAPTDITLTSTSISEDAPSLVIGTLGTTDTDQGAGAAFTYAIAEVVGSDHASFTINASTGKLSLKARPDFETKPSYSVTILSTDEGGKTFAKEMTVSVTDANDAPTIANPIANQTYAEDVAFSFSLDADVFADVDKDDNLSYTVIFDGGTGLPGDVGGTGIPGDDNGSGLPGDEIPLPSWLNFDAGTRTFSGTPANENVGTTYGKVTATDKAGDTITDIFMLSVTNTNDAPTVANAIADQVISQTNALTFQFNTNVFEDVDYGDSVAYTATLSDGNILPSWLAFDAATRTFSGTPLNSHIGTILVKVTATDTQSAAVSDTFNLTVTLKNDAPIVTSTGVVVSTEDSAYNYTFVATDSDSGDIVTYAATTLPSWLRFDESKGTLSGTPTNSDVGTHDIILTAIDSANNVVTQSFTITVSAPMSPVIGTNVTFTPLSFSSYELGAVIGSVELSSSLEVLDRVNDNAANVTLLELSGNQLKLGDDWYFNPETKTFEGPNLSYFKTDVENWVLSVFNTDDTDKGTYSNTGGPVVDATLQISETLFAGASSINAPYNVGGQPIKDAVKSGTGYIDALLFDDPKSWATSLADKSMQTSVSETVITYSFSGISGSTPLYSNGYGDEVTAGVHAFDDTHIAATRLALNEFSNIANLKFVEVLETGTTVGTMRFAFTDHDSVNDETGGLSWGWANGPYNQPIGGDIWVDSEHKAADEKWEQGTSTNFHSLMHEIGHALGLDHSFSGNDTLPTSRDFTNYTIMSYTNPSKDNYATDAWNEQEYMISTTPMVYDIAALQYLYGTAVHNGGDTVYAYDPAQPVSEAIWDSGGIDTLDFSSFALSCDLDLAQGGYSTIAFTDWTMTDNLGISYGTTIENAIGGSGSDLIVGNGEANTLYGGTGAGVQDTLTGNGGADIFVCSLSDAVTDATLADIISDFTNGIDLIGLEDLAWSDLTILDSGANAKIVNTGTSKVLFVLESFDHTLIESTDFVATDFV